MLGPLRDVASLEVSMEMIWVKPRDEGLGIIDDDRPQLGEGFPNDQCSSQLRALSQSIDLGDHWWLNALFEYFSHETIKEIRARHGNHLAAGTGMT